MRDSLRKGFFFPRRWYEPISEKAPNRDTKQDRLREYAEQVATAAAEQSLNRTLPACLEGTGYPKLNIALVTFSNSCNRFTARENSTQWKLNVAKYSNVVSSNCPEDLVVHFDLKQT